MGPVTTAWGRHAASIAREGGAALRAALAGGVLGGAILSAAYVRHGEDLATAALKGLAHAPLFAVALVVAISQHRAFSDHAAMDASERRAAWAAHPPSLGPRAMIALTFLFSGASLGLSLMSWLR